MPDLNLPALILEWTTNHPLSRLFFILMTFDLMFGVLRAWKQNQVNSTIARDGWIVKAGICLLITMGWFLEPYAHNVPVADVIALGFCWTEFASILENAALAGISIPEGVRAVLEKVVGQQK